MPSLHTCTSISCLTFGRPPTLLYLETTHTVRWIITLYTLTKNIIILNIFSGFQAIKHIKIVFEWTWNGEQLWKAPLETVINWHPCANWANTRLRSKKHTSVRFIHWLQRCPKVIECYPENGFSGLCGIGLEQVDQTYQFLIKQATVKASEILTTCTS